MLSTAGFQIFLNLFTFNRWFQDSSATFCLQPFSNLSATFLLSTAGLKIFQQLFYLQPFSDISVTFLLSTAGLKILQKLTNFRQLILRFSATFLHRTASFQIFQQPFYFQLLVSRFFSKFLLTTVFKFFSNIFYEKLFSSG